MVVISVGAISHLVVIVLDVLRLSRLVSALLAENAPIVDSIGNQSELRLDNTAARLGNETGDGVGIHAGMPLAILGLLECCELLMVACPMVHVVCRAIQVRDLGHPVYFLRQTEYFLPNSHTLLMVVGKPLLSRTELHRGPRRSHRLYVTATEHLVLFIVLTEKLVRLLVLSRKHRSVGVHIVHSEDRALRHRHANGLRWHGHVLATQLQRFPLLAANVVLLLLLFDDVLQEVVARLACNLDVAVLFKFRIVTFCLLRDAVPEKPTRQALVLVLDWENFEETSKVVQLVQSAFVNLSGEFLATHLVPEESALFVHFLQFAVANNAI